MILRPGAERIERRSVESHAMRKTHCHPRECSRKPETRSVHHRPLPNLEANAFGPRPVRSIYGVAPIFEQMMVEIDFHGGRIVIELPDEIEGEQSSGDAQT